MKLFGVTIVFGCMLFSGVPPVAANSATTENTERIEKAIQVMKSINDVPDSAIPKEILKNAGGIAIIPDLFKAAFGIGGRYGKGVMTAKGVDGGWSQPVFVTLGGGSIGWQWGVESIDLVLVFRTRESAMKVNDGKFTLGAEAGVAAGPIGRSASAATTAQMDAQILSYARSKGLFIGVSLDGARLGVDGNANAVVYGSDTLTSRSIFERNIPGAPAIANEFTREMKTIVSEER